MSERRSSPWGRWVVFARATVLLCALFLTAGPLNHHDVACHLKSSTHCTACVYASVPGTEAHVGADVVPLLVVGLLWVDRAVRPAAILVSDPGGRSPPVA